MTKTRHSSSQSPLPPAARLLALLEEGADTSNADSTVRAQADFWARMRSLLAVNGATTGLRVLDDLAVSVLLDETTALSTAVHLLPPVPVMQVGLSLEHEVFSPTHTTAAASSTVSSAVSTKASKRPATRSSTKTTSPPNKKQRASAQKTPSPVAFSFDLASDTPAGIRRDLARLIKQAAAEGKGPFRLAYPWRGQRAWYAPNDFAHLHLKHWRLWMKHRRTFFILALYAPSDKAEARRKAKASAIQARLQFLSANIEVFGYYGFMDRYEHGAHDNLMWLGGKAAKHSADAKDSGDRPQEDLVTLFRRDRPSYDRTIARALDPFTVDDDGYGSIPELLEQSQALDPTRRSHLRLSDKALARIALDVAGGDPPVSSWVGNRSSGSWKKLLSDRALRATQVDVAKSILAGDKIWVEDSKPYKPSEKGEDDSDFEDEDEEFMVLPPTSPVKSKRASKCIEESSDSEESGDQVDDDPDDEEAKDEDDDSSGTPKSGSSGKKSSPPTPSNPQKTGATTSSSK
uniref:Uncharacterized protein n=1 Tax=Phytophthora ramorum TaxID=164328 RepID=H3H3R5_PHYRM